MHRRDAATAAIQNGKEVQDHQELSIKKNAVNWEDKMIKIIKAGRSTRAVILWPVRVLLASIFSVCICLCVSACGASSASNTANTSNPNPLTNPVSNVIVPVPQTIVRENPVMLLTEGTPCLRADGTQKILKGVNLGNWLMQEFWMMGQATNGIDDQCKLEAVLTSFGSLAYEPQQAVMAWMTSSVAPDPFAHP